MLKPGGRLSPALETEACQVSLQAASGTGVNVVVVFQDHSLDGVPEVSCGTFDNGHLATLYIDLEEITSLDPGTCKQVVECFAADRLPVSASGEPLMSAGVASGFEIEGSPLVAHRKLIGGDHCLELVTFDVFEQLIEGAGIRFDRVHADTWRPMLAFEHKATDICADIDYSISRPGAVEPGSRVASFDDDLPEQSESVVLGACVNRRSASQREPRHRLPSPATAPNIPAILEVLQKLEEDGRARALAAEPLPNRQSSSGVHLKFR